MKIDTRWGDKEAPVVAFYDIEGVRYFLHVASRDAPGANVARASECTIVDDDIAHFSKWIDEAGRTIWIDKAAREDGLLEAMIEHDADAIRTFWSRLDARVQP